MDSLLPCAFCQGEAKIRGRSESFYAACTRNECAATTRSCRSVTEAQTVWNTRTPPASEAPAVTEEMVERAMKIWSRNAGETDDQDIDDVREMLKAALGGLRG